MRIVQPNSIKKIIDHNIVCYTNWLSLTYDQVNSNNFIKGKFYTEEKLRK